MTVDRRTWDLLAGAESFLDVRRFDDALRLAHDAVAAEPSNARAHFTAARALTALDRHAEAVESAQRAVGLEPAWAQGRRVLSTTLRRSGANDSIRQAVTEATEAVRLAPANPDNHLAAAAALADSGDRQRADAAVIEAIRLAPVSAGVWTSASYVAIKAKNWHSAEIAARRALLIDPDNYQAMNNLGVALRGRDQWHLAAVLFLDAARIDPRSPMARTNVEDIGFMYLATLSQVPLLPLIVVWPLFVVASVVVHRWLRKRPARLQPLARRVGIRRATRGRYRRRLDRRAATVRRIVAKESGEVRWSSLSRRRTFGTPFLVVVAISLGAIALLFMADAVYVHGVGPVLICAAIAIVCGAGVVGLLRCVQRRRASW